MSASKPHLDMSDPGLAAWKISFGTQFRLAIDSLRVRENWVVGIEEPTFIEEISGLADDMSALANIYPEEFIELFDNDEFLDKLRIALTYIDATARARMISWLGDKGGNPVLERLLTLPPVDEEPAISFIDPETPVHGHEIVMFLRNFIRHLRRVQVAQRIFSEERLSFLIEKLTDSSKSEDKWATA